MHENELKYWLALNRIAAVGPRRWQKILNYFPALEKAWEASLPELTACGLEPGIAEKIQQQKLKINPDQELRAVKKTNCRVTTILDNDYPPLLKQSYDCPPLIYYFGQLPNNQDKILAVVGSRKISPYGLRVTRNLVTDLATYGLTIVSGLALGIDEAAHKTTLEANGKTIAVLGSGLNNIYPKTNSHLAEKIIESGGAVLSELPPDAPPFKSNFVARNRIIAGLSLGALVCQAAANSGALITAYYALENNREVFSVPANIFDESFAGNNRLIKQGAKVVTNSQDICEALNIPTPAPGINPGILLTKEEKNILELIKNEPQSIDQLARLTGWPVSQVNTVITTLEIKGLTKNLSAGLYGKI